MHIRLRQVDIVRLIDVGIIETATIRPIRMEHPKRGLCDRGIAVVAYRIEVFIRIWAFEQPVIPPRIDAVVRTGDGHALAKASSELRDGTGQAGNLKRVWGKHAIRCRASLAVAGVAI